MMIKKDVQAARARLSGKALVGFKALPATHEASTPSNDIKVGAVKVGSTKLGSIKS